MRKPDGSWEKFDDYVIDFALERLRAGERVALVTLVKIEGSSPRPLGAQMAVAQTGEWVGYLSGGCIEHAVVAEAQAAIEAGERRRVRYGRGSKYLDIQLPCGSAIELLFDVTVTEESLADIEASLSRRRSATLLLPDALVDTNEAMIREFQPRRRLIIVGVGPAAAQLAVLGFAAGFKVELHSPDRATRQACSAAGVTVVAIDSVHARPDFGADRQTAIVFMFHDHEWESTLIPTALASDAFYIGAMGSRRAHARRMEMLRQQGCEPANIGRVRGPAGLFSGAKSASDVAISILAEVIQMERGVNIPLIHCRSCSSSYDTYENPA